MKKAVLLISMIFLFASNGVSQGLPSGTVTLIKIEPAPICQGDSFTIHFLFHYSGNPDTMVTWVFNFWRQPFSFFAVRVAKYYEFYHMTKNLVGTDTVYTFKAYLPTTYTIGPALFCINGQQSCLSTYVEDCKFWGVGEHRLNTGQVPVYYDLFGNIIEPRNGEIIIEQVGNRRRKLVIQP